MKTLTHKKYSLLLLFLVLISPIGFAKKVEADRSKTINKSFQLKDGQKVSIQNKFGDVNITSSDSKQLMVEIKISVEIDNESKAQKLLDGIEIDIDESAAEIKISTEFDDDSKWKDMKDGKKIEVNYIVKMPKNYPLEVKNSFGEISLGNRNARTTIDASFGGVKIGKLLNEENSLEFQFSDPVIIDEIAGGEIELKFSKMELSKAGNLVLKSEMSTSTIDKVVKADFIVKMGGLTLTEVEDLKLKSNMSSVFVDKLYSKGDIDVNYGKLEIEMLSKDFTELKIDGDFTPIRVNLEEGLSCSIEARSKMASLNLPKGLKVDKSEDDWDVGNNEYFNGSFGSSKSQSKIVVTSSFGSISIK